VVATIYYLRAGTMIGFADAFQRDMAQYVSEKSWNTFARLPVREKDYVFVTFTAFGDADGYLRQQRALEADETWRSLRSAHAAEMERAPETLLLQPTARSLVR
jgi:hypothetical protein